jgi:hypothetical protein
MGIFEPVNGKPVQQPIFTPIFESVVENDLVVGRDHRDTAPGMENSREARGRGRKPDWIRH